MPLEEICPNIPRSTSVSNNNKSHHESSSLLPVPRSAVQSMLKTTTELGNLGQFSSGPSRLPRSGSRVQTTRVRSGSYDTSFASALRHNRSRHALQSERHHGPRSIESASTLSGQYTSRSNLSSHAPSIHSRRHRQRIDPTSSPHPSIYTHRSLVTLRSQQDVQNARSVSPAGPPHRMRRPPYRASSPTYTDSRTLHTPQPGFFRAPSTGTVTSSPASAYRRVPSTGPYRRDWNTSYSSLHHPHGYYHTRSGPFPPFAPPARLHTPRLGGVSTSVGVSGNVASLVGIPQSPSGSTAPAYYDYTESFTEETCFSPDSLEAAEQPPLTINQTIWEGVPTPPPRHAQTPFGTREGSKFYPSELPTKHNRRPSEQSKDSLKSNIKPGQKPNCRHNVSRKGTNDVPENLSSVAMSMANDVHVIKGVGRRSRSHDSGSGDPPRRDPRRASTISRRSLTASPSNTFFAGASRSPRDLAMLAARVHSPVPDISSPKAQPRQRFEKPDSEAPLASNIPLKPLKETTAQQTPDWLIPSLTFRPMSFMSDNSGTSTRPRTSEAETGRHPPEIHSPIPKRPTSSQSRKRFSKILDIEPAVRRRVEHAIVRQSNCVKWPNLKPVEESPANPAAPSNVVPLAIESNSPAVSLTGYGGDAHDDKALRISGVTSHDKSTVESLLDKHIECLGLQPDFPDTERTDESPDTRDCSGGERHTSTDTSTTIRLTDILANIPIMERGRPKTSASQQYSSLATLDRQALKPRRLFASMDARVPGRIEGQSLPMSSAPRSTTDSRPSFGWQTLPSTSFLVDSARQLPSWTSGELGDVETTETTKLNIKRRPMLRGSASEGSILSTLSSDLLSSSKTCGLHKRSKSEIIARQASRQRRRVRIRLKMRARSKTTGDLLNLDGITASADRKNGPDGAGNHMSKDECVTSLVKGYAELSGDSVPQSHTNLASKLSRSPPIPTRWSSIIAAMPQPGEKHHEAARKPSVKSNKSQRSNNSIVDPVNTTRIRKGIPRMDSVPRLGQPDFGPPLISSELNLSIPYADVPSTIPPTLRETKSFFSDDSSAQRQRGTLRQKLHLHSLRNVMPTSAVSSTTASQRSNGVTLSHSCQMKGRICAEDTTPVPDKTVPMTDFAFRRRKVMGKLKDWWRRQCLQKVVQSRKRRERNIAEAVIW